MPGFMDALAALGKLGAAREAISATEKVRRDKTREALRALFADARPVFADPDREAVIDRHIDKVLAASSQGNAVREIAKVFGVWDALRTYAGDLLDKLEGKDTK